MVHALSFVTPLLIDALPTIHFCLGFLLGTFTLAFLIRIILSWYPKVNAYNGFWGFASWSTEPVLVITRKIIPPIGGVDITPVIWVALTSLFRELLVGQQGLLTQVMRNSQGIV